MDKISLIRYTFRLAKKGEGFVSPNPIVGCVIYKNGKIISTGYHKYFGAPHAEIDALKKIDFNADGATMFLNLQPCCHFGKTPPCTDAIIKSGIKKVIFAMKDPNPGVKDSIKILKRHNIKVEYGILYKQAEELNRAYIKNIKEKRPYIIVKSAISLDGKLATNTGESKWISNEASRRLGWKLRTKVDAILVGANTIIKDNPSLSSHSLGKDPIKIILDEKLKIPVNSKIFKVGGKTIIITKNKSKIKRFPLKVSFIILKYRKLKKIVEFLLKKFNIGILLVEGGGITIRNFFKEKLVDEVYLFIAPKLIGGRKAPSFFNGKGFNKLSEVISLKKCNIKILGDNVCINGLINYG